MYTACERSFASENGQLAYVANGRGGGVVAGVPVGRTQRPAPGVALSGAHQDWATEVSEGIWVCWWDAQNAVPAQRPLKRILCAVEAPHPSEIHPDIAKRLVLSET